LQVTILGTGTSQGVPVIGCKCPACLSDDSIDQRLRSSLYIESGSAKILVDIGPDFRQQMLSHKITDIDGVLITHEHNDHIIGLDDIRPFNFMHQKDITLYAHARTIGEIKSRFAYAFLEDKYPGTPLLKTTVINEFQSFKIKGLEILPIPVKHGTLDILGFRIGKFVYITDANKLSNAAMEAIAGAEVLILNALRMKPHHSHYTLSEALSVINQTQIPKVFLSHISHAMGPYSDWKKLLPAHVASASDGQIIELAD